MKYCSQCGSHLKTTTIDGVKRRACSNESCSYVVWGNPVPVVAALVLHNDTYIIARNALWPQGIYSLITGYLEKHEHPDDAVLREVKEELNLDGEVKRFLGHFSFAEKNQLLIAYEVEARGELALNHEIAEIKQLTHAELLQYDFAPLTITQQIIASWQNNKAAY